MAKVMEGEAPKTSFLRYSSEPNGESILATDAEYEISGLAGFALCLKGSQQALPHRVSADGFSRRLRCACGPDTGP